MRSQPLAHRVAPLAGILAALFLMAGCATQRAPEVPAVVAPPSLQLIAVGKLEVPRDCAFRSGRVYRTRYQVRSDGRVEGVAPDPAPACLQAALADWVGGFQYVAPGEPVASVIDWMGVSGKASAGR